jgi:ribosomal protein L16/L10AE
VRSLHSGQHFGWRTPVPCGSWPQRTLQDLRKVAVKALRNAATKLSIQTDCWTAKHGQMAFTGADNTHKIVIDFN